MDAPYLNPIALNAICQQNRPDPLFFSAIILTLILLSRVSVQLLEAKNPLPLLNRADFIERSRPNVLLRWRQGVKERILLSPKQYVFKCAYGVNAVKFSRLQDTHNHAVILGAISRTVAKGNLAKNNIRPSLLFGMVIVVINVFLI